MESPDAVPTISDVDSCMNYLREVSLYKMMNDPNHRAMLYILELLMNSGSNHISMDDLATTVFSTLVSEDIKQTCGSNADGLRQFLRRYPSLFRIEGSMVSPVDVGDSPQKTDIANGNGPIPVRTTNLSQETEAVKYFQSKLAGRGERWIPVKSLAGHLSQASDNIRNVVGPQAAFKKFLQRHHHVFEIQGDLVSLRDQFSAMCLSRNVNSVVKTRPKSVVMSPKKSKPAQRPASMVISSDQPTIDDMTEVNRTAAAAIDSREFQAAMFLRTVIRRKPRNRMSIAHLFLYLAQASADIRDCIGWTRIELEEFLRKKPTLFRIDKQGHVATLDTEEITIVVNDSPSGKDGVRTVINHHGKVYHVTKLWGIIDLGEHEHVFFDKSIFRHLDDLQRHFQIGELVYFNAILAPKQSRAKWRATQVWKESDKEIVEKFCGDLMTPPCASVGSLTSADSDSVSCCRSILSEQRHIIESYHEIDEELAEIIQLSKGDSDDYDDDEDSTKWETTVNQEDYSVTSIPSPISASSECLSTSSEVAGDMSKQSSSSKSQAAVGMVNVSTQTISTGDIMAVQVYHEPLSNQL